MGNSITITNKSGKAVYVYDWDMSLSPAVAIQPVPNGNPLAIGASLTLNMQQAAKPDVAGRRIYFSDAQLTQSLEGTNPVSPDAFTPWNDGAIMYSFVEYLYDPTNSRYTFDLSYIDTFSYPITTSFSGGNGKGYQSDFEYGFTSLSAVKNALIAQTSYPWNDLIWPNSGKSNLEKYPWPAGIYRIIGPNKVWASNSEKEGLTKYAPSSYATFVSKLPFDGNQLFKKKAENLAGWLDSTTLPATTGYVEALRSAATPDASGKYGFFTYPKDNASGEFTWLPLDALCTLKIYAFDA